MSTYWKEFKEHRLLSDLDSSNTYELDIERDKIKNAQIKPIFRDVSSYIDYYPDAEDLKHYYDYSFSKTNLYKYGIIFYPTYDDEQSLPGNYLEGYIFQYFNDDSYTLRIGNIDRSIIKKYQTLDEAKKEMIEIISYVPFRLSDLVYNLGFQWDW